MAVRDGRDARVRHLALAASLRRSGSLRGHPDAIEGPAAWREKREPQWQ